MAKDKVFKIVWGDTYANTMTARTPLDNAKSYSRPRAGSETVTTPSGVTDSWIVGDDELLEGDHRWIPTANEGSITGWDGATGVNEMLKWLRKGNKGRWYGDKDVGSYKEFYLEEPWDSPPDMDDASRERRVHYLIRSADDTAFTGY